MADREKVINGLEKLRKELGYGLPDRSNVVMEYLNSLTDALALLKEQNWVKCSDRMPEEHETIFAKLKGTDKWNKFMYEKMSDDVRVVEVFEDGTRCVFHSYTIDGKWENERSSTIRKNSKITHWMPNPELPDD